MKIFIAKRKGGYELKQNRFCMRIVACILTASMLHPAAVFSAETEPEFEIRDGVLIRYHGQDPVVHVPEGVTEIGERAFQDSQLGEISIPDTVTQIGAEAFAFCPLHEIVLPDSVTELGSGAFCYSELESAVLSASLTEIPDDAFADCPLQSVVIPDAVTVIGKRAFQSTQLETVTLSAGLQEIREEAFANTLLQVVEIPDSVRIIGSRAFFATALETVSIPASVEEIQDGAFMASGLQSVALPDTAVSLGSSVFSGTKLESFAIPESLKEIPPALLESCPLRSVTIPDGVTAIGESAFSGTNLKSVVIPDSVETIGCRAFLDSRLESVQLPQHLTVIPDFAFSNCPLLSLQIPDTVTEIGKGAFSGAMFESAVIPESVQIIGKEAFAHSALRKISFAGTVSSLADDAFSGTPLQDAQSQDDFQIADGRLLAYRGTDVNVTLPEGITAIGSNAFQHASRMLTVQLPASLRVIEDRAFYGCTLLRGAALPDGVTEIGTEAFAYCTNLRKILLPDSVRSVGASAFAGCTALTDLRLNDGLEHLGLNAADGCAALETLRIPESLAEADSAYYLASDSTDSLVRLRDEEVGEIQAELARNPGDGMAVVERSIYQKQPASLVIYGEQGTAAEQIAAQSGTPLKPLSALPPAEQAVGDGTDQTLVIGRDTWHFANTGEVFGEKRYLTDRAKSVLEQQISDTFQDFDASFEGSCYGMALTVVLAKQGLLRAAEIQTGAKSLGELEPTAEVQSIINFFQYLYHAQNFDSADSGMREDERFAEMVTMAGNVQHGAPPFVVAAALPEGGHALVGFGLESGSWEWDGRHYDSRILLWDPNLPDRIDDARCLYFDAASYDYCIPHYGVLHVYRGAQKGRINSASSDPLRLMPVRYPFSVRGDFNCDGTADVSDAVLLARYLNADKLVQVTDQGLCNAELDGQDGISPDDLDLLLKRIARLPV